MSDLSRIIEPYDKDGFYSRYWDPVKQECGYIPPEDYPEFLWDYCTIWDEARPSKDVDIGECFAMIDRQGRAHVRQKWNGREWLDQEKDFEYWVKRIVRERGPNDWVTTINYHY